MRRRTRLLVLAAVTLGGAGPLQAQIADPIPEPLVKRGLAVEIREIARLPDTSMLDPYQSLQSGFIGFEFHPEFVDNGLLYTAHVEHASAATPDFIPPGFTGDDVRYNSVITQWRATDPRRLRSRARGASWSPTERGLAFVAILD